MRTGLGLNKQKNEHTGLTDKEEIVEDEEEEENEDRKSNIIGLIIYYI